MVFISSDPPFTELATFRYFLATDVQGKSAVSEKNQYCFTDSMLGDGRISRMVAASPDLETLALDEGSHLYSYLYP